VLFLSRNSPLTSWKYELYNLNFFQAEQWPSLLPWSLSLFKMEEKLFSFLPQSWSWKLNVRYKGSLIRISLNGTLTFFVLHSLLLLTSSCYPSRERQKTILMHTAQLETEPTLFSGLGFSQDVDFSLCLYNRHFCATSWSLLPPIASFCLVSCVTLLEPNESFVDSNSPLHLICHPLPIQRNPWIW
jgi:hypothetical protein